MMLPICIFDAKNQVLCPQCETKLESGKISKSDIEASFILAKTAKTVSDVDNFSLFSCKEFQGNYVISLAKEDIIKIRQSRTLYRALQEQFKGKIWLVEANESDKQFIEDLFFPTKILSINSVWAPGGLQKTKAVVSGRWTSKFPINIDHVKEIVKKARNLDIDIEFEVQKR
jgi:hypothetical protein